MLLWSTFEHQNKPRSRSISWKSFWTDLPVWLCRRRGRHGECLFSDRLMRSRDPEMHIPVSLAGQYLCLVPVRQLLAEHFSLPKTVLDVEARFRLRWSCSIFTSSTQAGQCTRKPRVSEKRTWLTLVSGKKWTWARVLNSEFNLMKCQ